MGMPYDAFMNMVTPLSDALTLPPIGAHFSTSGGLHRALEEAYGYRCGVAQLFTASPRQWSATPLREEAITPFAQTRARTGVLPLSHAVYLINLAASGENGEKSLHAFVAELRRCETLAIPLLVVHPGSAGETPLPDAIRTVARRLDEALERSENQKTLILLETTAGQGHCIGAAFEHLAEILGTARNPDRLGVCFDTAHAFEAGYDLLSTEGYENTFETFFRLIPLDKLRAFHLNDSKTDRGSMVDRHAHLGEGRLGLEPIRRVVTDPRFARIPKCLETEDDAKRPKDIRWLHRFLQSTPGSAEESHHERPETPRSGRRPPRPRSR